MSMKEKFLIVKDEETKEIRYFDYEKIKGYNLQAKKNIHFQDSIDVSRMIIIKPTFIEKIATKKINAKFDRLINLVSMVCDQEDDETGESYRIALDEANKLKMELINKYKKYISAEKLELMMKKIEILEDELKLRLDVLNNSLLEKEKTEGKRR